MKTENINLTYLDEFVDDKYGKVFPPKEKKFDRGFDVLK